MPIAQLTNVPALPANFASRAGLGTTILKGVKAALEASGICLIHGEGGMGKTVSACAALKSEEGLAELFPGGAAYVTIGQVPDILSLQARLLRSFDSPEPPADIADGYARLLGILAGRQLLLVLDDVWDSSHLECFTSLRARPKAWNGVVVLCTTRFAKLVPEKRASAGCGAELVRLGELTDAEASQLLGLGAEGAKAQLSGKTLAGLTRLCARSPLALSVLGATGHLEIQGGASNGIWSTFCEELAAQEKAEPNAVKRCIGLAAKRLCPKDRELYFGFAVFPDDVLLPVQALKSIFRKFDLDLILPRLAALNLIRLEEASDAAGLGPSVSLHDLSLEFVKDRAGEPGSVAEKPLHEELLQSYSSCLNGDPGEWWTGPDDGYFFQRLLQHLSAAGRLQEAQGLLLQWQWLAARLRRPGDVVALIADIRELAPPGALPQASCSKQQQQASDSKRHNNKTSSSDHNNSSSNNGNKSATGPVSGSAATAATALGSSASAKSRNSAVAARLKAPAATTTTTATAAAAAAPAAAKAKAKSMALTAKTAALEAEEGARPPGTWEALLEVLSLSAHVLAEDARQLPFQVLGRLLGLETGGELSGDSPGAVPALRAGASEALKAGSFPLGSAAAGGSPTTTTTRPSHRVSLRPVSPGTLRGVGGPLQRTLQLHKDWVRSIAVSGDGSLLVSGSNDLSVKVWDLQRDCRLVLDLTGHLSAVFTVDVFGQDLVASGDKDEIIIWSVAEGTPLRRWPGFDGRLCALRFLGSSHVAASVDKAVSILPVSVDNALGAKACSFEHEADVSALATSTVPGCSSGEFLVACGCDDGHVVLWRLSPAVAGKKRGGKNMLPPTEEKLFEAKRLARVVAGEQDTRAVHLSPAGDLLACGNDDCSFRVWEVNPEEASPLPLKPRFVETNVHSDWIHSICLAANGSLVACGSDDNSISLYDVEQKSAAGRALIFSGAFSVAMSPDLHWLFSASGDIRVWSVPKMLQTQRAGGGPDGLAKHSDAVTGLDVSADGCIAASVCPCKDNGKSTGLEIAAWNCETGKRLGSFTVPSEDEDDRPRCLCLSPDGSTAVVGSHTGKFWVLSLKSMQAVVWVQDAAHEDRVNCCQWLDKDSFATGGEDGTVRRWSLSERRCLAQAQPYEGGLRCFAFASDNSRVLCGGDYQAPRFMELDAKVGRCLVDLRDSNRDEESVSTACSVALSSDGRRAVTCSWDKALRVWNLDTGKLLLAVTQVSEWVVKGFVASLAGDAAGLCVSSTWDRQLQLWDLTPLLSGESAASSHPIIESSAECAARLCTCQCDASLVRMASARRWIGDARRSLVCSDEDGGLHFFEVELRKA